MARTIAQNQSLDDHGERIRIALAGTEHQLKLAPTNELTVHPSSGDLRAVRKDPGHVCGFAVRESHRAARSGAGVKLALAQVAPFALDGDKGCGAGSCGDLERGSRFALDGEGDVPLARLRPQSSGIYANGGARRSLRLCLAVCDSCLFGAASVCHLPSFSGEDLELLWL